MYLCPGSLSNCCRKSHSSLPLVVGDSPFSVSPAPGLELEDDGSCDGDRGGAELVTDPLAVGVAELGERCWLSCIESSLSLLLEPLELPENKNLIMF